MESFWCSDSPHLPQKKKSINNDLNTYAQTNKLPSIFVSILLYISKTFKIID